MAAHTVRVVDTGSVVTAQFGLRMAGAAIFSKEVILPTICRYATLVHSCAVCTLIHPFVG